jgi:hypothetical protein
MDTYNQPQGSDQQPTRSRRGSARWYVGAAAALLAVGIVGGVALAGNSGAPGSQAFPAAATGVASPAGVPDQAGTPAQAGTANPAGPAGPTGQAAVLSAVLSSAAASAATTSAAGVPARAARRCGLAIRRLRAAGRHHAARVVRRHCRRFIRRRIGIRLLGGMYGQFTFRTASGTRTIAYERGTVVSDDGSSVVVRAADGTAQTWRLVSDTVVRRDGGRVGAGALAAGQSVFVAGPVVSGVRDIRLAAIRPTAADHAATGS